jgi:hypothetical protein
MRGQPRESLEHCDVLQARIGVSRVSELTQRLSHQPREAEPDSLHRSLAQRRDAGVVEVQSPDRIVVAQERAILEVQLRP